LGLRLGRPVALKMLLAGAYAGPQERERFLREAKAVAGLRHPNLVQVYDMGDHEGRPYFTMEYAEGGSLAQRLTGTPLGAHYAAGLVATLAEAVQVAHQGGAADEPRLVRLVHHTHAAAAEFQLHHVSRRR
jgi:serine/threonine-protein kinase